MYIFAVGDVDIHGRFSRLKIGKYTNFNMAMNIVLHAVCSPSFYCMSAIKLSQAMACWKS